MLYQDLISFLVVFIGPFFVAQFSQHWMCRHMLLRFFSHLVFFHRIVRFFWDMFCHVRAFTFINTIVLNDLHFYQSSSDEMDCCLSSGLVCLAYFFSTFIGANQNLASKWCRMDHSGIKIFLCNQTSNEKIKHKNQSKTETNRTRFNAARSPREPKVPL